MIDLKILEIKYEEEDLALILLHSLSASYKNFRDTLIYTKETLKVEDVKLALFSKELMDKELIEDTKLNAYALLLRNSDSSSGYKRRPYMITRKRLFEG